MPREFWGKDVSYRIASTYCLESFWFMAQGGDNQEKFEGLT